MLKIRKGGTELLVPSGSYENIYESLGFEIVKDKSYVQPKPTPTSSVTREHIGDKKVIKEDKDINNNVQNKE